LAPFQFAPHAYHPRFIARLLDLPIRDEHGSRPLSRWRGDHPGLSSLAYLNPAAYETRYFGDYPSIYAIMALWGALCGIVISKHYGFLKSVMGKAILMFALLYCVSSSTSLRAACSIVSCCSFAPPIKHQVFGSKWP
jgi:hypothetical protein